MISIRTQASVSPSLADTRTLGMQLSVLIAYMTLNELLGEARLADSDTLRWAVATQGAHSLPEIDAAHAYITHRALTRTALIMELVSAWSVLPNVR